MEKYFLKLKKGGESEKRQMKNGKRKFFLNTKKKIIVLFIQDFLSRRVTALLCVYFLCIIYRSIYIYI